MNNAKTKKGANNRWSAPFGRSRSKFPTNQSQQRDFKDWGRGQSVTDPTKPQTPSGPTIQSPLASLLGNVAQVFLIDGAIVEGVLVSVGPDFELSLKAYIEDSIETFKEEQDDQSPPTVRKELSSQISIEFANVVNIRISNDTASSLSSNDFQVDTAISDFSGKIKERQLTPWEPGQDDGVSAPLDCGLDHQGGSNGWAVEDMLHVNSKKFGVKSTFDSSMSSYMTPIDKNNPRYEEIQRDAIRIAKEMEGSNTFKEHENFDSGVGEEEAFSAVNRSGQAKEPLPSMSRGRNMRMQGHRPGSGRELGPAPGIVQRDQSKGVLNSFKKNGVGGGSPNPPGMPLSYSDKVKRSTNHEQSPSSSRSNPLMPVSEDQPLMSPNASGVPSNLSSKERNSIDHGTLTESGRDLFSKPKTTYSKYGREVPASKNTDDGNRSDLNDLKNFQSIQIQPGHDSKSESKISKRDSHSLKREDHLSKDSSNKAVIPNSANSGGHVANAQSLTTAAKSDHEPSHHSEQAQDSTVSAEQSSQPDPLKVSDASETKTIVKTSTLNPNAKEFKFNPHAPEFVPTSRAPASQQPLAPVQMNSASMSPMLQQQMQPEMSVAYQMQPQHIQLSSQQQQQQQQMAIHAQQQQLYSPHPVVIQPDQQRHPGQRKTTRPMGQAQVVFSAGPEYSGVPTATMAPFYSPVVPQVPGGGIPIQAQGVPQQSFGEGRPVFVVPPAHGPHPYAPISGGPMIFPVAQQAMQPNLPPGSVAVRNPGNPQVPGGQFIRYNSMQMVGSMPTIPSSQAYVQGQTMQNFTPMN